MFLESMKIIMWRDINYLLKKYSTKQPGEIWSPHSANQNYKLVKMKQKLKLFDGINAQYFHLVGSQKERAKYLIKRLEFKKICGRCSEEQIIVLICFYVKCEYIKDYDRNYCRKVFKEYNITDNLIDRFMVYLARLGVNEAFSK